MKKIEAVIRPNRLQEVQDALDELGASGITVTDALGCGAQRGYTEMYRGTQANISLQRKVKLEVVLPDDRAEAVIEALMTAARTGSVGDGKIFVTQVEDAIRIRTGERGEQIVQHRVPERWGH